jgi:hypothetical protein
MNILKKYIFFVFLLMLLPAISIKAQETKIYGKANPGSKTVNFGPCYESESINAEVIFEYYGEMTSVIHNLEPTLKITVHPLDNSPTKSEYRQFDPDQQKISFPVYMSKSNKEKVELPFYFRGSTKYGWYHATAQMGLIEAEGEKIIKLDTFKFKAKKTSKFIDGMTDTLYFDSVYVNPTIPQKQKWGVRSVFKDNMKVSSDAFEMLSPIITDLEFSASKFDVPPIFTKKYQTIDWELNYYPKNTGVDSANYFLIYQKELDGIARPDSAKVKLVGYGVEQEMQLIKSNFAFSNDTIFLGNVTKGYKAEITGTLKNIGNIPFAAKNESVLDGVDKKQSGILSIPSPNFTSEYIHPNESKEFKLNCQVDELGVFIDRYEIESNILDRDIFGVPADKIKKTIYVRGVGSAPRLRVPADTIDFGNIVINDVKCPSKKDTAIYIENTGNAQLMVSGTTLSPNKKFKLQLENDLVAPGDKSLLKITYEATDGELGPFESVLTFNTNDKTTEYKIVLLANGIAREDSWLFMPNNLKSKPGRTINVPIILEDRNFNKHHLEYAKNFTTTINFDSTMLRYSNYIKTATASENAAITTKFTNAGSMQLDINNGIEYFAGNDTLLYLQFKTYLGEKKTTPISFAPSMTKFGDGLCNDILNIDKNLQNGVFSLDSVCGLSQKLSVYRSKITLEEASPNPATNEVKIEFSVISEVTPSICVTDISGVELIKLPKQTFEKGLYNIPINTSTLPQGIYRLIIKENATVHSRAIVIIK